MEGIVEAMIEDTTKRARELIAGFARALDREADAAIEAFVTTGQGELPGEAWLLGWDVNSVHGYVFGTGNAMAIRGASEVLKDIDRMAREGKIAGLHREQILYAGGGGGIAVVSKKQSEELVATFHRLFAERSLVATCTVHARPIDRSDFGQQVSRLRRAMSRRRSLVGPDPEGPVPFLAVLCEVCGWRAAAGLSMRGEVPARAGRAECAPCQVAIKAGQQTVAGRAEETEFEQIASEDNLLGVIYLDGNGIGATIAKLKTPLAYARFSTAIDQLFVRSFEVVRKAYQLRDRGDATSQGLFDFQNPIAGGDDWVLIVPGNLAVPLARDFLATLESESDNDPVLDELRDGQIGAAAGVALGKKSMPIRYLIDESEDLLKSAKKIIYTSREKGQAGVRSSLDFGLVDDGVARCGDRPDGGSGKSGSLRLTGKPYALDQLKNLSERRIVWDGLPSSQRHAVVRIADGGPHQVRNHLLYQVARLDSWRKAAEAFGGADVATDPDRLFAALVPKVGEQWQLELPDLIELDGHWKEPKDLIKERGEA